MITSDFPEEEQHAVFEKHLQLIKGKENPSVCNYMVYEVTLNGRR
ncbi:MAG: hypothetical protein ACLVB1_03510 [Blautia obeum]